MSLPPVWSHLGPTEVAVHSHGAEGNLGGCHELEPLCSDRLPRRRLVGPSRVGVDDNKRQCHRIVPKHRHHTEKSYQQYTKPCIELSQHTQTIQKNRTSNIQTIENL